MPYELTQNDRDLIDHLMSDKEAFNEFVYTPWNDAITELKSRAPNSELSAYITQQIPDGVPQSLQNTHNSLVLFRNVATPNYEMHRYISCIDALSSTYALNPLVWEYSADRFNNRSATKFALAKLHFHKMVNRHMEYVYENARIIDINTANNKVISELQTVWNQNLVEFHHRLLFDRFPQIENSVFDISDWLHTQGGTAKDYYVHFFALFLQHSILFESFLTHKNESDFTRYVVLPALISVRTQSAHKPLIIALDPPAMEGDDFWLSYPHPFKEYVDKAVGVPSLTLV